MRRFNGGTFGAAVALAASGDDAQDHITQDAAGRLHAVFPQGQADGLHLVHAASDDGAAWRSGTVLTQAPGVAIGSLRAAVAPDHVGVVAWETGSSGPDGRGPRRRDRPGRPVDPVPPATSRSPPRRRPRPRAPAKPRGRLPRKAAKAKRISRGRVRITLDGKLGRPAGVSAARGCRGSVVATVRRGKKRIARETLPLSRSCRFHRVGVLSRKRVKGARRLGLTLRFGGNAALASASRGYKLKVARR